VVSDVEGRGERHYGGDGARAVVRGHQAVVYKLEFEKEQLRNQNLKPFSHFKGSRVEIWRFQAMGQTGFNL
jgi:hypothetical protein